MSNYEAIIAESLMPKKSKNGTLHEWFKKGLFKLKVSETEKRRIANSGAFRNKLFLAGGYDFGLTNGCVKFANANGIKYNKETKKYEGIFPDPGKKKPNPNFNKKAEKLRIEYVNMIFETQDDRDLFYYVAPDGLSGMNWTKPTSFNRNEMDYQTDHVNPRIADGPNSLKNYCFLTASINEFYKNQLTIDQFLSKFSQITELCDTIEKGMEKREVLFASSQWTDFLTRVFEFEEDPLKELYTGKSLDSLQRAKIDTPKISFTVECEDTYKELFDEPSAA